MEVKNWNGILIITYIVMCCSYWIDSEEINGKLSFKVPKTAKPGHTITVLPKKHPVAHFHILSSSLGNNEINNYFSLRNGGSLHTTSDLTPLEGKTVSLSVQITYFLQGQKETISLDITVGDESVKDDSEQYQCGSGPYVGIIAENEPIGTTVSHLSNLTKCVRQSPEKCGFSLDSGDVDDFQLTVDSRMLSITSRVVLDREVKMRYYLTMKAECPGVEAKYSKIQVSVSDINDNAPEFGSDIYSVALNYNELAKGSTILQVYAKF